MYEYDYEEYFEPSRQDEIIQEATSKLINAVKDEVEAYYKGIIMENESLTKENERLMEIERDLILKEHELEQKEKMLERDFYKTKWSETLKDLSETYYELCYEWKEQEKCNNCDDDRKVLFTSLQGETLKQSCKCSHSKPFYLPKETKYVHLEIFKSNEYRSNPEMGYKIKFASNNGDDDRWVELYSRKIRNGFEIEKGKDIYDVVYKTLEECQKHCDYLNTERKTLKEWEVIKGINIIDYDGFDRKDAKLMERFFTEEEFDKGAVFCTQYIDASKFKVNE